MKEVLGSLPEVITAYKNYNLLVPTATDVQLNPFYKFHVEEVPVDLGENSGDIFKVDSHPRNRKTPRGIKRFITGWLERSQNSMPASRTPQAPAATKNMSTDQYMEATSGWCEGMGD